MRYQETKQQSNELLRLLVPLMSKHEAACNPVTYTLWYEYLAGINPHLKTALDQLIDEAKTLTDSEASALFRKHILMREDAAQEKYESDFMRLIGGVSGVTASATEKAGEFVDVLEHHGSSLTSAGDSKELASVMRAMLNDTLKMRESVTALNEELNVSLKEVESLRQELERTQTQALIDPLTGVRNRRGIEKTVDDLCSDAPKGLDGCCVMMIDIDDFKRINDSHGHLLGDKVIRTVAQLLTAAVKGQDTVARWGGEEFMVLLPQTPLAGAKSLAESIRSAIERGRIRRHESSEYIGAVTVSIGVAFYKTGETFEEFVLRSDLALYGAKRAGRNRVMAAL